MQRYMLNWLIDSSIIPFSFDILQIFIIIIFIIIIIIIIIIIYYYYYYYFIIIIIIIITILFGLVIASLLAHCLLSLLLVWMSDQSIDWLIWCVSDWVCEWVSDLMSEWFGEWVIWRVKYDVWGHVAFWGHLRQLAAAKCPSWGHFTFGDILRLHNCNKHAQNIQNHSNTRKSILSHVHSQHTLTSTSCISNIWGLLTWPMNAPFCLNAPSRVIPVEYQLIQSIPAARSPNKNHY